MHNDNATTDLARQDSPKVITGPLVVQATPVVTPGAGSVRVEEVNATVTRRRQRVKFRKRYESRGVDRYRDFVQATTKVSDSTLDVKK